MMDHLARRGADVIYGSMNPPIHVSGHASVEELKLILNLVRPRYFVPIHGEFRMLTKHARLAEHLRHTGTEEIFILDTGDLLETSGWHGIQGSSWECTWSPWPEITDLDSRPGESIFLASDHRQYINLYARVKGIVANRVHAAVCRDARVQGSNE